ncbi:MAG TPA: M23 family metallopeptidase [Dehalococcoidia bacterium]|nr:M23 family metallopeptidase [Dehalococcoidia bacterium]
MRRPTLRAAAALLAGFALLAQVAPPSALAMLLDMPARPLQTRRAEPEPPPPPEPPPFPAPPGYRLPWPAGVPHTVTQGPDGSFSHGGMYAYDFDLRFEVIVAARGGRVAMVREDGYLGGCDASYGAHENYIVIDHGDGTAALYLHIDYDGALVREGQLVRQGDAIAYSGDTGVTCAQQGQSPAPHLHFQVQKFVPGYPQTETLPFTFDDVPETGGRLAEGQTVVSGNGASPHNTFYVFMSWVYTPRAYQRR